jgi:hypothetical protein
VSDRGRCRHPVQTSRLCVACHEPPHAGLVELGSSLRDEGEVVVGLSVTHPVTLRPQALVVSSALQAVRSSHRLGEVSGSRSDVPIAPRREPNATAQRPTDMVARIDPDVAVADMRAAGVEPMEAYATVNSPWRGQCTTCGNEVSPRLSGIRRGRGACRFCAGNAPVDAETARWEFAEAGAEMVGEFVNVRTPTLGHCLSCGKEISPRLADIRRGQGPCRSCGHERGAAKLALDSEVAAAVMRAARLEPLVEYPGSGERWRCRCLDCGRNVTPTYGNVLQGHSGCAFCSGARVNPADALRAMREAGLEPLVPFPGATFPWPSQCAAEGHRVSPRLASVRRGRGCNRCGELRTGDKLRTNSDEAVELMLASGWEPLEPYRTVSEPWRSLCKSCGREGAPTYGSIKAGNSSGCRRCGLKRAFAAARAAVEEEAVGEMMAARLRPVEPFPGVATPWRSVCLTHGHEVSPQLSSVRQGRGCNRCGYIEAARKMQIPADEAAAAMRERSVEPLEPYPGSKDAKWRCQCTRCDTEIRTTYGDVVHSGGTGCVACGRRQAARALMRDSAEAAAVMHAANLGPLDPYPGTGKPWRSRCLTCSEEVAPHFSSVLNGGGCRYCAPYGIDLTKPSSVYLFRHDRHRALKIGITNDRIERLIEHEREGWTLIDLWSFDLGSDAHDVEQIVLDAWDDYEHAVTADDMPQSGYTETVSMDDVSVVEAVTLIEGLAAI